MARGPTYWLPRLVVAASVAAVALPLPRYMAGLEAEEKLVWLTRAGWVLGLVGVLLALGWLGIWLGRRRR